MVLKTLVLEHPKVEKAIGSLLSLILKREVQCTVTTEGSWWAISSPTPFKNEEIRKLIDFVGGGKEMEGNNIPKDAPDSKSLDMDLCESLLKLITNVSWVRLFVTEEALWVTGYDSDPTFIEDVNGLLVVENQLVDRTKLLSVDEIYGELREKGFNYKVLSTLCERHEEIYGRTLLWHYPFAPQSHLALCREGILFLPHIKMPCLDGAVYEIFDSASTHLLSKQEMDELAVEFRRNVNALDGVLSDLAFFKSQNPEYLPVPASADIDIPNAPIEESLSSPSEASERCAEGNEDAEISGELPKSIQMDLGDFIAELRKKDNILIFEDVKEMWRGKGPYPHYKYSDEGFLIQFDKGTALFPSTRTKSGTKKVRYYKVSTKMRDNRIKVEVFYENGEVHSYYEESVL